MRFSQLKATMKTAVLVTTVLLLGASLALAQQQVNLTAGPSNLTLPDGSIVPMWGYTCTVTGTALATGAQTCALLNPNSAGNWAPIVITVPGGQILSVSLTNSLPSPVPTSLVIVGQLGGGLGTTATSTPPPDHTNAQSVTWPIPDPTATGTAPIQGNRVQSFSTEVAAGATTTTPLTWSNLKPGTYLIESGTHPSIQGPMGLYGIVVVTAAPGSTAPGATASAGCAYGATTTSTGTTCAVPYNTEIPLLFSEIDPVQNSAVNTAVNTPGFSEAATIPVNLSTANNIHSCVDPANGPVAACYPPAVNYTPLYYLINGVAFDKTKPGNSLFSATPGGSSTPVAGTVLVRLVNAGLRMHVPSIVGAQTGTAVAPATIPPSGFSLIAEDGNSLPGVPRVQSEVFMAAGKTYDVMVNVPTSSLAIFDRELSLSGHATARDAGMLAYISVNGAGLPAGATAVSPVANAD